MPTRNLSAHDLDRDSLSIPSLVRNGNFRVGHRRAGELARAVVGVALQIRAGWAIMPDATGLWVRKIVGTTIIFR